MKTPGGDNRETELCRHFLLNPDGRQNLRMVMSPGKFNTRLNKDRDRVAVQTKAPYSYTRGIVFGIFLNHRGYKVFTQRYTEDSLCFCVYLLCVPGG